MTDDKDRPALPEIPGVQVYTMDSFLDMLTRPVTGMSNRETIKKKICPTCAKPVGEFRDELSVKEYRISGMCQECQDSVFGSPDKPYVEPSEDEHEGSYDRGEDGTLIRDDEESL